jgi:hypothetical protein
MPVSTAAMRSFGKRSNTPWKIISVMSGMVSAKAVRRSRPPPLRGRRLRLLRGEQEVDADRHVELAAASQNGSSSGERFVPPDGHAEIATPRKPSFLARCISLTATSTPTFGVWKMPISDRDRGAEAFLEPAVVGADAGEVRVLVLVLHEREHGALRRVEHLGVDAVDVHDLQTLGAVVAGRDGWSRRSARPST